MKLQLKKEFYRTVDAGSNEFAITLVGDKNTPFMEIEGMARNIFEGNTFHLDDEFNEKLEHFRVDPYDIVLALEAGDSFVECNDIEVQEVEHKEFNAVVNTLIGIMVKALNIKSIEDGRSVGEDGTIVGIEHDDTIVHERVLAKNCINAGLSEEWNLLKKRMKLED